MIEVVTIANVEDGLAASLAKQALEVAHIPVLLADELTVHTAWHLTIAVRWIKLQVPAPEVERALTILADTSVFDQMAMPGAPALRPEIIQFFDDDNFPATADEGDDDTPIVRRSWADRIVEQMFRAAVLSLLFFPLHFYSWWLLIRLLVSCRSVSQSQYWKVIVAIILNRFITAGLWSIFQSGSVSSGS